ncbi:MAG: NUDIX domain-containing protein [Clostridia bacterium]|nr:NUDIX domain-containing protein [Clostridia bacterium]
MEMVDILTPEGESTGRIAAAKAVKPGEYVPHAIVIIRLNDGRYVMQQRSFQSRYFPGRWDVTGGGVQAGETPMMGAVREAKEELGVDIDIQALRLIHRYRVNYESGSGAHISVFGATIPMPEEGFTLQQSEVNAVRLADFDEFYGEVMYNKDEAFGRALRQFEWEESDI